MARTYASYTTEELNKHLVSAIQEMPVKEYADLFVPGRIIIEPELPGREHRNVCIVEYDGNKSIYLFKSDRLYGEKADINVMRQSLNRINRLKKKKVRK